MSAQSDLVVRYLRYRAIGKKLNLVLTTQLTRNVLEEGGRDLGFLRKGIFEFDTEDESCVLMDYCIYNVFRGGRNAIQTLMAQNPPPVGSEESLVLNAMNKAWYSLFGVEGRESTSGVMVKDVFRQEGHLLIDLGLNKTAPPGGLIATRVIPFDDFIMTGGAALPLQGNSSQRDDLIGHLTKTIFELPSNHVELGEPGRHHLRGRDLLLSL